MLYDYAQGLYGLRAFLSYPRFIKEYDACGYGHDWQAFNDKASCKLNIPHEIIEPVDTDIIIYPTYDLNLKMGRPTL